MSTTQSSQPASSARGHTSLRCPPGNKLLRPLWDMADNIGGTQERKGILQARCVVSDMAEGEEEGTILLLHTALAIVSQWERHTTSTHWPELTGQCLVMDSACREPRS